MWLWFCWKFLVAKMKLAVLCYVGRYICTYISIHDQSRWSTRADVQLLAKCQLKWWLLMAWHFNDFSSLSRKLWKDVMEFNNVTAVLSWRGNVGFRKIQNSWRLCVVYTYVADLRTSNGKNRTEQRSESEFSTFMQYYGVGTPNAKI